MTVVRVSNPIFQDGVRDSDGHRVFNVKRIVETNDVLDGPFTVMNAPGLPLVGSLWNVGNDLDTWAFCWPDMTVKPLDQKKGESVNLWSAEQKFDTRPLRRCQDETVEDPLLEPDRLSGSFVKYTKEVVEDRFGNAIQSSSFETLRGPQVEFDFNRPTVRIAQNVAALELEVFSEMVDTVNDAALWNLGPRKVKLSNTTWQRLLYGVCNYYYTRELEFDIDFNGWDKTAVDEGTKALHGHWEGLDWVLDDIGGSPPDPSNPAHFSMYKDRNGENTRVLLDGAGKPLDVSIDTGTGASVDPVKIDVGHYPESNFLLLGIPTTL